MTMKYFNTHFVSNLQVNGCIETCCQTSNYIITLKLFIKINLMRFYGINLSNLVEKKICNRKLDKCEQHK
jgi:hypothetical protein